MSDTTPSPEAVQPVAWMKRTPVTTYLRTANDMIDIPEEWDGLTRNGWIPLYAAPPHPLDAGDRQECAVASHAGEVADEDAATQDDLARWFAKTHGLSQEAVTKFARLWAAAAGAHE
jgi:hypothetical protein